MKNFLVYCIFVFFFWGGRSENVLVIEVKRKNG